MYNFFFFFKGKTIYLIKTNIVKEVFAAIICHNDELSSSLTWVDCLQMDWEDFILLAESNQILLKFILLSFSTFKYLVGIYEKTEL